MLSRKSPRHAREELKWQKRTARARKLALQGRVGAYPAGIEFPVHPHMLRHAAGYYLANAGKRRRAIQLYLGHKNLQHTVRYAELAAGLFKDFWRD